MHRLLPSTEWTGKTGRPSAARARATSPGFGFERSASDGEAPERSSGASVTRTPLVPYDPRPSYRQVSVRPDPRSKRCRLVAAVPGRLGTARLRGNLEEQRGESKQCGVWRRSACHAANFSRWPLELMHDPAHITATRKSPRGKGPARGFLGDYSVPRMGGRAKLGALPGPTSLYLERREVPVHAVKIFFKGI